MSGGGKALEFWACEPSEERQDKNVVSSEEMLDVLNPEGLVVGTAPRSRVHAESLCHHAVHVLVWNHSGKILLQKRSSIKTTCPGMWDTSVGGHVGAGEPLLTSAIREAGEELGIHLVESDLTPIGSHWVNLPGDHELVVSWDVTHEGPFTPDPVEVERVAWFNPPEVETLIANGECTPHFVIQWRALPVGKKQA